MAQEEAMIDNRVFEEQKIENEIQTIMNGNPKISRDQAVLKTKEIKTAEQEGAKRRQRIEEIIRKVEENNEERDFLINSHNNHGDGAFVRELILMESDNSEHFKEVERRFFVEASKSFTPAELFYVTNEDKYLAYWPKGYKHKKYTLQSRNAPIGDFTEKWTKVRYYA